MKIFYCSDSNSDLKLEVNFPLTLVDNFFSAIIPLYVTFFWWDGVGEGVGGEI